MIVLGKPGGHASTLEREAWRRFALKVGLSAFVLGASLMSLRLLPLWLAAAGMMLATLPAVLAGEDRASAAKARAGALAERGSARQLQSCQVEVVVHGFYRRGRGDIDHIILGPQLAAVETKYGRGKVSVDRSGRMSAGGRALPKDPVSQVLASAALVESETGIRCAAVVAISGMTNQPFSFRNVTVCSQRDLRAVIQSLPAVMGPGQARAWAYRLHKASEG